MTDCLWSHFRIYSRDCAVITHDTAVATTGHRFGLLSDRCVRPLNPPPLPSALVNRGGHGAWFGRAGGGGYEPGGVARWSEWGYHELSSIITNSPRLTPPPSLALAAGARLLLGEDLLSQRSNSLESKQSAPIPLTVPSVSVRPTNKLVLYNNGSQ
jgi:hypothetical protein